MTTTLPKIEVEVKELEENAMFLNQHLGDGALGDTKFDASVRLPDMSVVVTVEKKRYMVASQSVITAILEHHNANKKK